MKTNERRFQVTVHYKVNDNGIIADGMNETNTATAEQAANWIIAFAEENSNYTVTEFSIRDCETFKKYRSNDADLQALNRKNEITAEEQEEPKMTTIEKYLQARDEVSFKYNKAGAKIWYRAHAIIETGVIDTGKAYAWSCDHDIKINRFQAALILEKYGLTIDQFIDAEKEFYATRYPETNNITEPDPDLYAVNPDALEVAVNAEIQNANNVKINDLKWEIRYTEGSIDDLDKNHIAHSPNDQSLQERRVELVNELAALKAQLADLLPTEVNTNSEYKYYLQSRRPIAGSVPNGYISATQGEMKVHSLRSDGSISPVPRKVVFGVVVYDHPLSDEQIINYDLHVDPRNPKAEPTPEVDEPKFQTGKSYYIKDGDSYYILKVEARTDKMLTGTTPHGTCKYHIHDTFKGEYIRTHIYDDCGNREMIWAANELKDPIIIERDTARNEYEEINQVRRLIEKDCERYERLRDRCKAGSPKFKEYNQLLADFDPIIRAFGDKFIAAQDRYNKSLTLRTDEEKAATQKAIDTHNADLDARGIKYFATVYYYPNGIEGEDMETFHKECTSLDEANAFVSQEDHDGVYVGGIYDAGWEITDRNHNLIADHTTGLKEEAQMTTNMQLAAQIVESLGNVIVKFANAGEGNNGELALHYETYHDENDEFGTPIHFVEVFTDQTSYILHHVNIIDVAQGKRVNQYFFDTTNTIKAQADFLADKIAREVKALDDYTTDRDAVFNLLPDLDELNDVDTTPDKNNVDTLTAVIAKYQAAFDAAQKASIADDMKFLDINKDTLMFSYGKLTAVISDRYNSEIRISGRKYFRYRGMIEKRADFLDHMNNEVIAADQRATFDEFKENYQLETDGDYFKISIFPRFANGTGSYFHATANDFNRALELVELFKTLDLPFDGTIKCNEISGKEYYHHNRDGSEVINPPELKLPANIKDSLQRAMKIALEAYRLYNLKHNQKAANRERECFMICKKALKEVA